MAQFVPDRVLLRHSLSADASDGLQAVRNERWKYIHYLELEGMDELYDLQADPYEMTNLINQPGSEKALAEMKQELARLLVETKAEGH